MDLRRPHSGRTIACLTGGLLAACADAVHERPDPGEPLSSGVAAMAVAESCGGDVDVEVLLVDARSRRVRVPLRYSLDGGQTWHDCTVRGGGEELATSPAGTRHHITWDALADLGARARNGVRLVADMVGDGSDGATSGSTARVTASATTGATAGAQIDNLPAAADRVGSWMMYFGPLDPDKIAVAETHDLVVIEPNQAGLTREVVAAIQDGVDPADPSDDVIVLAYCDVGLDDRTIGLDDQQLLLDPRFVGDGTGPRVDPRGPGASGQPLTGLDPLGLPSVAGGFASFYLDDASVEVHGVGDGHPDRDWRTGACVVNMGDPAWHAVLDAMTVDGPDGIAGFAELLTLDVGRGFGFDGLYLDGLDTCEPNSWTSPSDPVQLEFEWTAAGYVQLLEWLRVRYPEALLMQNRGLYFFNPGYRHYELTPGELLDFVLFSSYRLDADPSRPFSPYYFADNKFNFVPKLQAEANRAGGFQVLSVGFAEGPGIDHGTLLGTSTLGLHYLEQDIYEAQNVAGFRHYLTNAGGQLVNDFVRTFADWSDTTPPQWSSTWNDHQTPYPIQPGAPTPRVGIQEVVGGVESATVRWDVALDLNPVRYVLYVAEEPFDFDLAPEFLAPRRILLEPEVGGGYAGGVGPRMLPYETTITGLLRSQRYWFCIRAIDSAGNEDDNRVALSTRTRNESLGMRVDGDLRDWQHVRRLLRDSKDKDVEIGPDWKEIRLLHDEQNLYVQIDSHEEFGLDGAGADAFRIVIDADDDPFTGFRSGDVGGELAVVGEQLFRMTASSPLATVLQPVVVLPRAETEECELAIPLARIDEAAGGTATRLRIYFDNPVGGDRAPDGGYLEYRMDR
ncbi:MAG: hypothetical protein IPM29_04665 [Planctomycetes bacterium]|nr:hypothetical protein [Planctomycetota bacterium]